MALDASALSSIRGRRNQRSIRRVLDAPRLVTWTEPTDAASDASIIILEVKLHHATLTVIETDATLQIA